MADTIKIADKKHTKMVAHRGLSGIERENTLPAFVAAGNRSYFGAECDVHVTRDGKYLVHHDENTARLADKALIIEESTFDELRALKLFASDSEEYGELFRIPALDEYLAVLRRYDKVGVIELKTPMAEKNVAEIIDICRTHHALDKVIFISFFFDNLVTVRKLLPAQAVQLLTDKWSEALFDKIVAHKFDLDIGFWLLTEDLVAKLHAAGIRVNCWTCDDPVKARDLIAWGVDYITTDILE